MGTAVGTQVFDRYGWRPAASLSLAWTGWCLFIILLRGPHCSRYTWFGYEGGCELRKSKVLEMQRAREMAEREQEHTVAVLEEENVDEEKRGSCEKSEEGRVEDEKSGSRRKSVDVDVDGGVLVSEREGTRDPEKDPSRMV